MKDENLKFIAIGDIHGCSKTLDALLNTLNETYGASRTYVFAGDYTDRGPDSKGVVDLLLEFSKDHRCVFIRGNHDEMLLDFVKDQNKYNWFANGGGETLESYRLAGFKDDFPASHLKFFQDTRYFFDTPEFFFVHAGAPVNKTIAEAVADEDNVRYFLWTRNHLFVAEPKWEKTVVFGHTPVHQPIVEENMIGIDTGCVYKQFGKLTAVALPEREFIFQERLDF